MALEDKAYQATTGFWMGCSLICASLLRIKAQYTYLCAFTADQNYFDDTKQFVCIFIMLLVPLIYFLCYYSRYSTEN